MDMMDDLQSNGHVLWFFSCLTGALHPCHMSIFAVVGVQQVADEFVTNHQEMSSTCPTVASP